MIEHKIDELMERKTLDLMLRNIGESLNPNEDLDLIEYFIKKGEKEEGYDLHVYQAYVRELRSGGGQKDE